MSASSAATAQPVSTAGARTRTTTPTPPTPTQSPLGQPIPQPVGDRRRRRHVLRSLDPEHFRPGGDARLDTETRGRVYQMSSEHHVRHEVQFHNVAHWELHALQTEAERGESGFALPLEIEDSRRSHRRTSTSTASSAASSRSLGRSRSRDSHGHPLPQRALLQQQQSLLRHAVYDQSHDVELRQREFAWLDVSGRASAARPVAIVAGRGAGRKVESSPAASTTSPVGRWTRRAASTSWTRTGSASIVGRRSGVASSPSRRPAAAGQHGVRQRRQPDRRVLRGKRDGVRASAGGAARRADAAGGAAGVARAGLTAFCPSATGGCSGAKDALLPRTHHYLAPDGRTFVSATQGFVEGAMSWGVKSADLVRAFGLQKAKPGERVYLPSEAEAATWSARVGRRRRTLGRAAVRPAGRGGGGDGRGGERVRRRRRDYVYNPAGTLVGTIGSRRGPRSWCSAAPIAARCSSRAPRAVRRAHSRARPVARSVTSGAATWLKPADADGLLPGVTISGAAGERFTPGVAPSR